MERKRRTIFEIMEEVGREMDRLFAEAFQFLEPLMQDVEKKELKPLVHIVEAEDEVVVSADLPRVRREDIKVEVTEDELRIEALMRDRVKLSPWGVAPGDLEFTKFKKTVRLPTTVDPKGARARFKNGILEIRLPKKVVGHKISIE
jgi:HSP20 family protein